MRLRVILTFPSKQILNHDRSVCSFLSAADVAFDALCMYLYACVCARACGVTHKIMCVHEIQVFAENMVTKCYIVMFASMFFVSSSFYHLIGFSFFGRIVLSFHGVRMP